MVDLLLTGPVAPFTIALALLFGLLLLELALLLVGGTLLGLGDEADPDLDAELDLDLAELDLDLEIDADLTDYELPELDAEAELDAEGASVAASGGPLGWLGLGRMPLVIWMASVFLGFGAAGLTLQSLSNAVFGAPLPALVASLPAGLFGLWFARSFGALFARLLPKVETSALSERHLGRRMGIVSQGTARRGGPAEIRVTDRFGNTHYLRAEPLRDEEEISQGTEVLVLRHRRDAGYRIVSLGSGVS